MTMKPMGPAKRTRAPGGKDCNPLLELMEAGGIRIREFQVAHPSHSELHDIYTILGIILQ